MSKKNSNFIDNDGLIRKIAVLGKDYYSIRIIHDLFIFAGANPKWREEIDYYAGSERMQCVYEWTEGLKKHAPDEADKIIEGVALQMIDGNIGDDDKAFLKRAVDVHSRPRPTPQTEIAIIPKDVEQLLDYLIKGLPRAMFPLKHRRQGSASIDFDSEYDLQDLFHALLRPWIRDIRPEEYTPSYAGSSTRIDFLLPEYNIVCELKFVRDTTHAKKIGQELIVDIAHYRQHPKCESLVIVMHDPKGLIANPGGLSSDLSNHSEKLKVVTYVVG